MKKPAKFLLFPLLATTLTGCLMPWEKDTDVEHFRYYDEITGKFVLHDNLDKRYEYHDTYFEFNGAKGSFNFKYYENGELKKEGKIGKIVSHADRVGSWSNNLHFSLEVGKTNEHISTYTESFDPINQFRILEEYSGFDSRYYLSELPYVMGTYVREGAEYKEESPNTNSVDFTIPTENHFTAALSGKYALNDNTYFYFLCPNGWELPDGNYFYDAYFQYYAPTLEKPLEGFATGYNNEYHGLQISFKYLRKGVDWGKNPEQSLSLSYPYFDDQGIIDYKYGTVDFSNGVLNSFTFEKISRGWSEGEWSKYLKGQIDELPDPVQYDYVGGTYTKVIEQQN